MDKQSHFNLGMNSDRMLDANYNFNEITNSNDANDDASSIFGLNKDQLSVRNSGYPSYNEAGESSWKSENAECKHENDPMTSFTSRVNDCVGSFNNEAYQYAAYNQIESPYADQSPGAGPERSRKSLHEHHRREAYQISSMKNQLPSWYNPHYTPTNQHQGFFQHQYPYHQGSLSGPSTAPTDHNMRNMIHLTGRYLLSLDMFTRAHPRAHSVQISIFFARP
jgi:hypothetical protein